MKYKRDNKSYYRILGAKITLAREMRGIKQQDIALKLGISKAMYSNIEAGKNQIYVHTLASISEILDVKLERLLKNDI